MQNQKQVPAVLLMSQEQLVEFETECLNNVKTKAYKKIIKHLSRFLIDPNAFAKDIIDQYEANKAGKAEKKEVGSGKLEENPKIPTPTPEVPTLDKADKPAPLDGKKLVPVPEVKKP